MNRRTLYDTAQELLRAGEYERALEYLRAALADCERSGADLLNHTLVIACRICEACIQCRSELVWHQQAIESTDRREQALLQQLFDVLRSLEAPSEAIHQTGRPSLPEHARSGQARRPNLWQRLRRLIAPQPPTASTHFRTLAAESLERETTIAPTAAKTTPSLVVYCLGPFRVYQNDELITEWDSLKARSIFKHLIAHQGTPINRDILMDVLWPGADPEAARRNLHQAIYSLRQTLRRGQPDFQHVRFENDCYLLNPAMDLWLDFQEFERHVQAGRRLEAAGQSARAAVQYGLAENLYQGDFLEEDLYEDWASNQRQYMRSLYFDLTNRLNHFFLQHNEYWNVMTLSQKVLARDNCREEAHHWLMECYLAQGQRHLAVQQYQACVQALKEELDLAPSEETVDLYRRIVAG